MFNRMLKYLSHFSLASVLLFSQVYSQDYNFLPSDNFFPGNDGYSDGCCNNYWADAELVYWKTKDNRVNVPLVIQAPIGTVTPVLDGPGTSVVLGNGKFHDQWRAGARFAIGYWTDEERCLGFEASYFFDPSRSKTKYVRSNGTLASSVLAVPFFNVLTSSESSEVIARPGSFAGVAVARSSNSFQNFEFNALSQLPCFWDFKFNGIIGFRYFNFHEHFTFITNSPFVLPPVDIYRTRDQFRVNNNFFGAQLGFEAKREWCSFYVNAKAKLALGAICGRVRVKGYLFTNDYTGFTTVQKFSGGYFALPSNIGTHRKTHFSVIPELNLNLGYKLCDCANIELGYTCFYVSHVLRAGKQLDRNINPTQASSYTGTTTATLTGAARPRALKKTEGLFVQGLSLGFIYPF